VKINSLKEILIKKSSDNQSLQSFIYHMGDDHLVNYVYESLQKMASYKGLGKKPNSLILNFADELQTNKKLAKMMYDHLSHHATRYKAALRDKKPELAGQHMAKIFNNLHLLDKMINDAETNHTGGAINQHNTKWVDPKPWERNAYTNKASNGHPSEYHTDHYSTKTKGLGREHKTYGYLQQAPHHAYVNEVHGHGHSGAWPLEDITFNGKHLHIDDEHKSSGSFEPHPFDEHPILRDMYIANKDVNADVSAKHRDKLSQFEDTHLGSYTPYDRSNPQIGSTKPGRVHAEVQPLDIDFHRKAANPDIGRRISTSKEPAQEVKSPSADEQLSFDLPDAEKPKADVESQRAALQSILSRGK
jgi:hypothetical protein